MVGKLIVIGALLAIPAVAMAQTGGRLWPGSRTTNPRPTRTSHRVRTDNAQQPPNAAVMPATPSSQNQPNPLPQLSK